RAVCVFDLTGDGAGRSRTSGIGTSPAWIGPEASGLTARIAIEGPVPPRPMPRSLRLKDVPLDTAAMAHWLIGKTLVHDSAEGRTSGRIVETEAYPVGDASGHAFRGMTARNRSLFLAPGRAYVYFIYGTAYCLNVSAEPAGVGAG